MAEFGNQTLLTCVLALVSIRLFSLLVFFLIMTSVSIDVAEEELTDNFDLTLEKFKFKNWPWSNPKPHVSQTKVFFAKNVEDFK